MLNAERYHPARIDLGWRVDEVVDVGERQDVRFDLAHVGGQPAEKRRVRAALCP